ncbi:MAG: radical SAM protein [Deltaproteobacteria bacterium]|nr:radical SAM protein [Deltaproteobacteria bacterium]
MDKYRIDSHKLIFHPARTAQFFETGDCYPLYVEVSPTGACNHRCRFCALDFAGYQKRQLDAALLGHRLEEMGRLGVKSVMYSGEGEPFLHPELSDILVWTKRAGIDASVTTNGVLIKLQELDSILANTSWIKISINAGQEETYQRIHRTKKSDFEQVFANLAAAAERKEQRGYDCTLGMQLLLLPENAKEVTTLAKRARDAGADYLVVKPYSQHPQSQTTEYQDCNYENYSALAEELSTYSTENFDVIFRGNAMEKWDGGERTYNRCLGTPFWSYIDAGGNVWACSMYLNQGQFLFGNIAEHSFEEIWQGEKRRSVLEHIHHHLDATECRTNCRMDEINNYLWRIKHPLPHDNFI